MECEYDATDATTWSARRRPRRHLLRRDLGSQRANLCLARRRRRHRRRRHPRRFRRRHDHHRPRLLHRRPLALDAHVAEHTITCNVNQHERDSRTRQQKQETPQTQGHTPSLA